MRIRLGERLSAVLSLVGEAETLCDVGTDHGKLPVAALLSGRVKKAIAIDISEPSLRKAELLAEREGVPLRCVVGDGLTPLTEGECDLVVIAGMGGAEIVRILENARCTYSRYLLVPHRDAPLVRNYLKGKNIGITHDLVVREGKHFYFVIEADGTRPWTAHGTYVGDEGKDLEAYRKERLAKIERLLQLKQDLSLEEEKEELTHAAHFGDNGNA